MATQVHKCGACVDEFLTLKEYLEHPCPATGFTPTQPEHLGPEFLEVQRAALERGLDRIPDGAPEEAAQMGAIEEVEQKIADASEQPAG